jgi:hypothetical protein
MYVFEDVHNHGLVATKVGISYHPYSRRKHLQSQCKEHPLRPVECFRFRAETVAKRAEDISKDLLRGYRFRDTEWFSLPAKRCLPYFRQAASIAATLDALYSSRPLALLKDAYDFSAEYLTTRRQWRTIPFDHSLFGGPH